jgi:hypothetical protein
LLRGDLNRLPAEIVRDIMVYHLDIRSLRSWRGVNSFYRSFVDDLREYSLLNEYSLHTLRVMDYCGVSGRFTIGRLFAEFCRPDCAGCGGFGPLLFLPTLSRCCSTCVDSHISFQAMNLSDTSELMGISPVMEGKV